MNDKTDPVEDTPGQAASSISDALDFLREEADAVGMSDVSDLLQEASAKSRQHSTAFASASPARSAVPDIAARARPRTRSYLPFAAAATMLIAVVAVLAFMLVPAPDFEATYQTALGEHLEVTLPDDSVLTLNTDSLVSVRYTGKARRVNLERGEAWFDVTPAPARPFSVDAGSGTVRAVGTEFNVWLKDRTVEVTVGEGSVEVTADEAEGFAATVTTLIEGQAVEYRDTLGEVMPAAANEVDRQEAWREGMLDFQGETLASTIEEASRYTSARFTIPDPEIASLPVTAYLQAGDDAALIEVLESSLNYPLSVQRVADGEYRIVAAEQPAD